jgi:glycosyltransferase involved in cell wall biosynthesis
MDLVFAGHRCCDHSPSSGYDQVCTLFADAGWLDGRALEADRLEWLRETRADRPGEPRVCHVFYGDCSGKRLPTLLRRRFPGAAIVSTLHQPVARMHADADAWAAIQESDLLVTVSALQAQELRALGVSTPVHAIPHGVWTQVFRPRGDCAAGDFVLIVGSYLRDWAVAKQVIRELAAAGVRCVALGAGSRDHLSQETVAVDGLQRVSEGEFIDLYHRAAAVFLPFLEATASNALLEAMAAGCPVVCPRFPSIVGEYLGDDVDAFPVDRVDVGVARLLHYVRDPAARAARSQTLEARAQRFDWSGLETGYRAVYEQAAAMAGVHA